MNLRTLAPLSSRTGLAVWLVSFFSPTLLFFLILFADRFHIPAAANEVFVAALFYLVPPVGLLVSELTLWHSNIPYKIGCMLMTLVGMVIQCAILLIIIIACVSAAIAY